VAKRHRSSKAKVKKRHVLGVGYPCHPDEWADQDIFVGVEDRTGARKILKDSRVDHSKKYRLILEEV